MDYACFFCGTSHGLWRKANQMLHGAMKNLALISHQLHQIPQVLPTAPLPGQVEFMGFQNNRGRNLAMVFWAPWSARIS